MPRNSVSCAGAPDVGMQCAWHQSALFLLISGGLCGTSADHGSGENTHWCCCGYSCPLSDLEQWLGLQVSRTSTCGEERAPGLGLRVCVCVYRVVGLELSWAEPPSAQPAAIAGTTGEHDLHCLMERALRSGSCMQLPSWLKIGLSRLGVLTLPMQE